MPSETEVGTLLDNCISKMDPFSLGQLWTSHNLLNLRSTDNLSVCRARTKMNCKNAIYQQASSFDG